jgi:eukaryotic-like serine/threonine-protein kinase
MGQVWRARDTRLEREVALKVLPAETLGDATARARLVREARLASKLNHPHICTIYDVGEADSQTYIAMELVEGQPLSARVADGPLLVQQILRYGGQMADALAHAHSRGVVHRDFKSANVVVTPEGQVKVLDFGLARRLMDEQTADATTLSRSLTAPGVIAGTLAYMAPEQLKGQAADARSDIWALGVVLYELAAGKRPFQGQTAFDLTGAILSQPLPPLPSTIPAALAGVIDRCLAKEPGERYQQGTEVRAALEAVAAGHASASWSTWRVRLQRRRRLLFATALGAFALLITAAALFALNVGGLRSRIVAGPATSARTVRLMVLPFANVSGDATQEYVSDGLTTEMIALIGRLRPETLQVVARMTSMRYKKTDKTVDQIGRERGVDYILEGTAQREAGRIRVTADLIKVADQTQLWADRFEREAAGILMLQSDVAQQVAKALALKLLPAEQARLAGARTVDPEVYDLCLRAKDYLARMTAADFDTAEQFFQRALAKAPASAAAYAGLAQVWAYRAQLYLAPPREAGQKARTAALKAIELDDTLAEAHVRVAAMLTWSDFSFPDAEREFKRALDLDPNNPEARVLYGHLLMILRRPDEAMRQSERAVAIDPLDVAIRTLHATNVLYARRYDEVIGQANEVLRMQPGHLLAAALVFYAQHAKQRYAEAIAAAATYYRSMGWRDVAEALERHYPASGYAGALRRAMEVELAKHGNEGAAWDAGTNLAMIGDRARALDLFEKAYADRDPNVPYLSCMPLFDSLRAEPRYQALLRQMGLPR